MEVETLSLVDKGRKIKESDVIFIESYEDGIMLKNLDMLLENTFLVIKVWQYMLFQNLKW